MVKISNPSSSFRPPKVALGRLDNILNKSMKIHENPWKSMEIHIIHGNPWKIHRKSMENLWNARKGLSLRRFRQFAKQPISMFFYHGILSQNNTTLFLSESRVITVLSSTRLQNYYLEWNLSHFTFWLIFHEYEIFRNSLTYL